MSEISKVSRRRKLSLWGRVRARLRDALFQFFGRLVAHDQGTDHLTRALRGFLCTPIRWGPSKNIPSPPYPEIGLVCASTPSLRSDIIIITARFRSGSTLLWNLFRQLQGYTSYYEPLNERRWFDPATRGSHTDQTHKHAEEYWREYEGLTELGKFFRTDWHDRHFFMSADFWDPDLKNYVDLLIERAPGRPVLQFNRIDLRLAWFRRNYPNATYVHLYRHPRDQWCSALMDLKCFGQDGGSMAAFEPHDKFYLRTWCRDLRAQFPFLDERGGEHPYYYHYLLWKLSYLYGADHCDHSVAFEHLVSNPAVELPRLLKAVHGPMEVAEQMQAILVKPALGKWKEYAEDTWFRHWEEKAEQVFANYLPRAGGS